LLAGIEGLIGSVPLTVVGFSQGVATATRWAVNGSKIPSRLVLWGDFSPPDLDLDVARQRLDSVDVIMVRGRQDPALSSRLSKEEAERLRVAGIAYRTISYSGGHDIDEDTLRKLSVASR